MPRDRDPEGREREHLLGMTDLRGKGVVDIGAGAGFITRRYAALTAWVVAVDPKIDQLAEAVGGIPGELARKLRRVVGNGQELPLSVATCCPSHL